jgi:hypothetical protein
VQVPVHFVGPPAADEANAIAVDAGAQERHGAAGSRGPHRHIGQGVGRIGDSGYSRRAARILAVRSEARMYRKGRAA